MGLKLLIEFSKSKVNTIGIDQDKEKINNLRKSKSTISYIKNKELINIKKFTNFENKLKYVKSCDVIILCLPTPIKKKLPDISEIKKTMKNIKDFLKKDQILILESTTYPGTTDEIIKPFIKKNMVIGKDFYLCYSPERENPGSKIKFKNIPKICSGYSKNCLELCKTLYSIIVNRVVSANNIREVELTKLVENIYRSVNIGLVNELKMISSEMKINFMNVLNLASTKPFGFEKFVPGPGVGGHCIPIDPYYLSWKAKKFKANAKFIELAGRINEETTNWIYKKIIKIIKTNQIELNFCKILIIGIAYKKNIEDTRESAAIKLIQKFSNKNVKVDFYDPYKKSEYIFIKNKKKLFKSINFSIQEINKYDVVILLTDHDNLKYNIIKKYSKILIDTRNKLKRKNLFYTL